MTLTLPPDAAITQLHSAVTDVTARVDIFESDGVTPWLSLAPVVAGSVSISSIRDERRTANLTFENVDGVMNCDPDGFWYDKIVKIFRGVHYLDENGLVQSWEAQLGEFLIDTITQPHFPHEVEVSLRDQTKKLLNAKFATSTTFAINQPIEEVIRAIAINGGIPASKISFPLTGKSTGRAFTFERGTERWRAMAEIASSYNYDLWFRGDGVLTMAPFKDPANPAVSPSEYRFETGPGSNRVPNEGFETGLSGNANRAAGWQYGYEVTGVGTTYSRSQQSFTGQFTLTIENPTDAGSSVASDSIPVVAGEVWDINYVAHASVVTGSGRYMRVIFHTQDNGQRFGPGFVSYVDVHSNAPFSTEWVEYSAQVTVPNTATHMRVVPYAWQVAGQAYTAFFDDITAVKVSPIDVNQGNIAGYSKSSADARVYNHIVVTGESADTLPVYAEAENNNVDSPTRIERIGRRTYFFTSSFITTVQQAQDVANRFLKVHALEQFEVNIDAIVAPYLDANIIVDFMDPEPTTSAPIRFLLSELTIPLSLGTLSALAKRVTVVG